MITKLGTVKLDTLTIPRDLQRDEYSRAGHAKLKDSISKHGILVPVIVRKGANSACVVVDGVTRTRIARELGMPGNTPIPCVVIDADENAAIVAGLTVNQARERLSTFCEFKALYQLVGRGMEQQVAAEQLGKTKSWASKMMSIDRLPARVKKEIDGGKIPVTHGMVMAECTDDPELFDLVFNESLAGNASASTLHRIVEAGRKHGLTLARRTSRIAAASGFDAAQ